MCATSWTPKQSRFWRTLTHGGNSLGWCVRSPRRATARVPAKIALTDLGVRNAILRGAPSLWESPPDVVGPLVETLSQGVIRDHNLQVHYYRYYEIPGNRRSPLREVDFIVEETDGAVLPIEIKFRRRIQAEDLRSLRLFIDRFKAPHGVLVTRDSREWLPKERILLIPLLDFLLHLGA
ncbi:MAG: DUF4143 domain-containing protein [Planctomycetes bacterium]|nr:DUF4143 domain-containing protein [Planctomycetota bacterium]